MAEEATAPEETQDTPTTEAETPAPETGTPDEPTVDWQQRYENLQPEFTRATQEAAELRQYQQVVEALQSEDPQMVQAAVEALGLELIEDDDGETPDPVAQMAQRVEGLESQFAQQAQNAEQQHIQSQEIEYIDQALKGLEGRIGRELNEPEVKLLVAHAALDRTETGEPGIEAAIGLWEQLNENAQAQWAASKKVSTPAVGREGTEALPLDAKHGDRVADMVAKLEANR